MGKTYTHTGRRASVGYRHCGKLPRRVAGTP